MVPRPKVVLGFQVLFIKSFPVQNITCPSCSDKSLRIRDPILFLFIIDLIINFFFTLNIWQAKRNLTAVQLLRVGPNLGNPALSDCCYNKFCFGSDAICHIQYMLFKPFIKPLQSNEQQLQLIICSNKQWLNKWFIKHFIVFQ